MTEGQLQIAVGVIAVIVAIVGIFVGAKVVKRRRNKQWQRTGKGSISIQSGRDTNVDRIK